MSQSTYVGRHGIQLIDNCQLFAVESSLVTVLSQQCLQECKKSKGSEPERTQLGPASAQALSQRRGRCSDPPVGRPAWRPQANAAQRREWQAPSLVLMGAYCARAALPQGTPSRNCERIGKHVVPLYQYHD